MASASQVGHMCCKSKCVKWVKCVATGASGSNRLIIPTPTCNQLLVPVCTRTATFATSTIPACQLREQFVLDSHYVPAMPPVGAESALACEMSWSSFRSYS